jgi:hypothetical protein
MPPVFDSGGILTEKWIIDNLFAIDKSYEEKDDSHDEKYVDESTDGV